MNIPNVAVVGSGERRVICTVNCGDRGDYEADWAIFDLRGTRLSYGYSRGWQKSGVAAVPTAMSYAKAAARRWLRKYTADTPRKEV